MARKTLSILAPLGIVLVLMLSGTAAAHVLKDLGVALEPGAPPPIANSLRFVIGEVGLLLFGVGVVASATLRGERSTRATLFSFATAVLLAIGCLAVGYGTWVLMAAFRTLASAATIDSTQFVSIVSRADLPLLSGWICVLVASILLFVGDVTSGTLGPVKFTVSFWIGLVACAFLLLAVISGASSIRGLASILAEPSSHDPTSLASSITGMLLARFVSVFGIAIASVAVLLKAFNSQTPASSTSGKT